MKKSIIFITYVILVFAAKSQTNIAAKLCFVDANLYNDVNQTLFKSKITNDGLFTFEPGISLSAEFFQTDDISLKIMQTVFADQASNFASNTQLLLRFKIFSQRRNSFTLGIGPVLFARNSWETIDNYTIDNSYNNYNNIQYRFFVLSGELEYNRLINKKLDLSISLNHLHPYSIAPFIGIKYWFSRKSLHCNTCPSYH